MKEVNKGARMIHVWNAVRELGRASPEEVMKKVALKLDADVNDKNFKRNIYRDLRDFALNGDLAMEGFTPDGERIETGDESDFKNIRLEYYIPGEEGHFPGGGLLRDSGCQFVPPQRSLVAWNANLLSSGVVEDHFSIIFQSNNNLFLAINAPREERPLSVVIARKVDSKETLPLLEDFENAFGKRSGVLYTFDKTVSRAARGKKLGHALIEFNALGKLVVRDFDSSTGTFWSPASSEEIISILNYSSEDQTQPLRLGLTDKDREWSPVAGSGVEIQLPTFVRFGNFFVLMMISPKVV